MSARIAAERLLGCEVVHIESVPIVEQLSNGVIWEGMVEVFRASDSPTQRLFIWAVMTQKGPEWMGILNTRKIRTAADAVKSWATGNTARG